MARKSYRPTRERRPEEHDDDQFPDGDEDIEDPNDPNHGETNRPVESERLNHLAQIASVGNLHYEEDIGTRTAEAEKVLSNSEAEKMAIKAVTTAHEACQSTEISKSYSQLKMKYKRWCEKLYDGDYTVNQEKAVRFIVEEYVEKPPSKGTIHRTSTITTVCNNLVDLFQEQANREEFPNARHPRGVTMNQLINVHKLRAAEMDRTNYSDRAEGTSDDGYDFDQMVKMLGELLSGESEAPIHLRTRLILLLSHSAFFRGCNIRGLELADLSCTDPKTSDPTPLVIFNMLSQYGKTKKMGKKDFCSTVRHKDPKLCLIISLAMFLFFRFQMTEEGFPDMKDKKSWYTVKLIIHVGHCRSVKDKHGDFKVGNAPKDNTSEISAQGLNQPTRDLFKKYNVPFSWSTNYGSSSSRSLSQFDELENNQRSGWTYTTAAKSYMQTVPQSSLRVQAGFTDSDGTYFLPRDTVDPPDELLQQIFPGIEEKLAELQARVWRQARIASPDQAQPDDDGGSPLETEEQLRLQEAMVNGLTDTERSKIRAHLQKIKDSFRPEHEQEVPPEIDMAAVHFLKMLLKLRRVLLQDMAILGEEFPNNILLAYPVFKSGAFKAFAERVREAHRTEVRPLPVQFQSAYPELCAQIQSIKNVSAAINKVINRTDLKTSEIETAHAGLNQCIDGVNQRLDQLEQSVKNGFEELKQLIVDVKTAEMLKMAKDVTDGAHKRKSDTDPVVSTKYLRLRQAVPVFKMRRDHEDVRMLWDEWTKGDPCVESMNANYGSVWRIRAEKKFYHRRKPIIDGIKKTIKRYGRTEEQALCDAEQCRSTLPFAKSLHQLARLVKKNTELGDVPPFSPWDESKAPLPEV